jgi:hypothetical protein
MMLRVEGVWLILEDRMPIVIYTGNSFLLRAKIERCFPSNIIMKGSSASPTLSIDKTSISKLLSLSISNSLCLPPAVCSVHFGIEAFRVYMAVKSILKSENVMLGIS